MKICLLTTRHTLFDDLIYYRHAVSLAKKYGQVWLVGPCPEGAAKIEDRTAGVQLVPITNAHGGYGRVRRIIAALQAVKGLRPDVCHFYDPELLMVLPLLRRNCSLGVVYDALEAYPEAILARSDTAFWLRKTAAWAAGVFEKRAARQCAKVFTADEATAQDFISRNIPAVCLFNFPPKSIFDCPQHQQLPEVSHFAQRPTAIYVGSMSRDRGLFKMIQATAQVRQSLNSFKLLLIGLNDGPLLQEAKAAIERSGVVDAVQIMPWIPHETVRAYVQAAKVGLAPLQPIPKYFKNIPQKIFEYMACGVPVVGADLPTIAPFLRASGCGVVADCTRADLLAEAILNILRDAKEWTRMSDNGQKAFRERYNWECMEPRLWETYAELEHARRPASAR